MALLYPTLALIFLAIGATALGEGTLAEANGEVSQEHDANANATAPVNPAPAGHHAETSRNQAANGVHVGAQAGSIIKGHHPPGKGHHKEGGHRKKGGHKRHPAGAPADAPASPVPEAQPASAPASPVTKPQPAQAPAAPPSTATPPTSGRVQIPPELRKLSPSLPPSAEPPEIKELISKATGVDPSKIPEISDPKQIEEVVAKAIGMNGLPPNTDPKQIEDIITQATGMKTSDALAALKESGGLEAMLITTGALSPSSNAEATGTPSSTKEASDAFTIGATPMAPALVAAVAAGCFIF